VLRADEQQTWSANGWKTRDPVLEKGSEKHIGPDAAEQDPFGLSLVHSDLGKGAPRARIIGLRFSPAFGEDETVVARAQPGLRDFDQERAPGVVPMPARKRLIVPGRLYSGTPAGLVGSEGEHQIVLGGALDMDEELTIVAEPAPVL
jgi:hypothetical protein